MTAETITDEQIRALRDEFSRVEDPPYDFECPGGRPSRWVSTCNLALLAPGGIGTRHEYGEARASLAELLNARSAK